MEVSSSPPPSPGHPYERSVSPRSASRFPASSQPSQQSSSSQPAEDTTEVNSDNSDNNNGESGSSDSGNGDRSDNNEVPYRNKKIGPSPSDKKVVAHEYLPSDLNITIADCQLVNPFGRILPPYKPITFGSLPKVHTDDYIVNSIIKDGLKLFLPSICCREYTPNKYSELVSDRVNSGVLTELPPDAPRPNMLFRLFPVPKSDIHNP